jgi:hypothetical protein
MFEDLRERIRLAAKTIPQKTNKPIPREFCALSGLIVHPPSAFDDPDVFGKGVVPGGAEQPL